MMKKVWKNRKGVSPVIATILMVAITVVLAAVLYVMVMGFNQPGSQTPTGTLSATKTGVPTATGQNYTITLISISKNDVNVVDCKLIVTPAVTAYTAGPLTSTSGLAGGKVVAGDYAAIASNTGALTKGTTYTASLLYVPTGNNIASVTFVA